jgi:hypothetical protein
MTAEEIILRRVVESKKERARLYMKWYSRLPATKAAKRKSRSTLQKAIAYLERSKNGIR